MNYYSGEMYHLPSAEAAAMTESMRMSNQTPPISPPPPPLYRSSSATTFQYGQQRDLGGGGGKPKVSYKTAVDAVCPYGFAPQLGWPASCRNCLRPLAEHNESHSKTVNIYDSLKRTKRSSSGQQNKQQQQRPYIFDSSQPSYHYNAYQQQTAQQDKR